MKHFFAMALLFITLMLFVGCGGNKGNMISDNSESGTESGTVSEGHGSGFSDSNDGGPQDETVLAATEILSTLVIAEGETLFAPDGYSMTMTVDGIETAMAPGAYKGAIVLTVTPELYESASSGPFTGESYYRTAGFVDRSTIIEKVTKNILKNRWDVLVRVKEPNERVELLIKTDGGKIAGFLLMSQASPCEAAFLNCFGDIDLSLLGKPGAQFNIPPLEEVKFTAGEKADGVKQNRFG